MPARPSPRLSVTILLTILAGVCAVLAGILGNLATSAIPPAIAPYLRFTWPALGVVVLLGIGVSVWQVRRDALASSPSPPARQKITLPSPMPTSSQQQHPSPDYHTCVLSYATQDQACAEKLYADLQSKGVSCWFAPHDLKTGDRLRTQIYEAIQKNDKLLLILSEHAVTSDWVEREVELAFERERQSPETTVLFPIRLDEAVMHTQAAWAGDIRRIRVIGDFRKWQDETAYQQAVQRLVRDLHR
ncbi:MAG: toll/interleukin-1 receptor domain-containing protein [Ktedonobacteraceae bacterium]